jgi:mRNA interferase HigB
MKLVGKETLAHFVARYEDSAGGLRAWVAEAEEATWLSLRALRGRYPKLQCPQKNRAVFEFSGGLYRLDVKIDFANQVLFIKRAATRAESENWTFEASHES